MTTRIRISEGAIAGKLLRHFAWVLLLLIGLLALFVGLVQISRNLLGATVGLGVGRSLLWIVGGLGFTHMEMLFFRLRHAFAAAYVFSNDGVEVTPDGEMTRLVRWPVFARAVLRPMTYTIELWAPDLERPIAVFNSAFQRRRYFTLKALIERNLGSRVETRYL